MRMLRASYGRASLDAIPAFGEAGKTTPERSREGGGDYENENEIEIGKKLRDAI
jgi:hypothetical protein